tara:strand:+ start:817 stop:1068 length:252 start_codon:yes stop_codon:yes gene_type:complete
MALQIQTDQQRNKESKKVHTYSSEQIFSKDYVDFLNDAGWRLEKKFPSNSCNYSELLEDTDWKYHNAEYNSPIHYRRDLDALS